MRTDRALGAAALAALALVFAAAAASAHIVSQGVGMQIFVDVRPAEIRIEYNLGFSDMTGYEQARKMDKDRNGVLSKEEIDLWLDEMAPKILRGLDIRVDEKPLALRVEKRRVLALFAGTDLGRVAGLPFDTFWNLVADVSIGAGDHTITIADRNFEGEWRQVITWLPKPDMHVFRSYAFIPEPKAALLETHPKDWAIYDAKSVALMITFAPEALAGLAAPPSALPGGVPATPPSAAEGMRKKAEEEARLRGVDYRGSEELAEGRRFLELRDTTWYIAIGLALLWGAAHALAPGHGKSMVAAYLLGTEGRIGDAIALGGIVTLTHAGSIFLIAMFAFFLAERVFGVSEHAVQAYSAIGLEIASGVLVAAIGLGIFAKRLRQYRRGEALADHAHGPGGHAHDHGPEHRHPKVGEGRDLISLGFAAGLQPCTAGLMLVGMSIAQGWLWKGLYLLLAFSLGLGAVLVAVAVSMVLGKKLLAERIDTSEGSFVRTVLPLVSAACLAAVGVFIVVDCLIRNKIL